MTKTFRTTPALALCAAACLLVLTACGGGDDDSASSDEPTSQASPEAEAGAGADLEGVPEVVAEVNGEEVTRDEFALIYEAQLEQATAAAAEQGGEQPDEEALKEQTANNLVDTELLAQEAEARGIEVSDEDVDAELTSLAESNQMASAQEFIDAVVAQGTTEEQVRSQVELQVMVEQLVADEAGPSEPTEEELRATYEQAKKQAAASGQGQQIPPFAEVRDQLEEQAQTQQVGAVAKKLVDELRKDADITINL
ncbi:MAG: SurA N-terminal domain-containing protein [Nocardioides sp.]|nr:SurA N-terminal domain-containing protein [Nocardioides sp.]